MAPKDSLLCTVWAMNIYNHGHGASLGSMIVFACAGQPLVKGLKKKV